MTKLEVGEPPPRTLVVLGLETHHSEKERVVARDFEALNLEVAPREERGAAWEAEAGRARAIHTRAPDDPKVEHEVSPAAQED